MEPEKEQRFPSSYEQTVNSITRFGPLLLRLCVCMFCTLHGACTCPAHVPKGDHDFFLGR